MKTVHITRFGEPGRSVACVEVDDAPSPAAGQVRFEIIAFPINTADVLLVEGKYAAKPPLPAPVGAECVGRITDVGEGVTDLSPGDLIINLARDNWAQAKTIDRALLVKVPRDVDPLQLAMLKVNPATALLMLRDYVTLQTGDWVMQNAANSAVGGYVIRLAKKAGFKTVNIVRRERLTEALVAAGADQVLVDGPDLAERVNQCIGERQVALGIDAVAGDLCDRMASCMRHGSVLVNYGLLSGNPCQVSPDNLVFAGVSLQGFWLAKYLLSAGVENIEAIYSELASGVQDGSLRAPVEAVYEIDQIQEAVAHAAKEQRGGKILVTANGPL